MKKVVDKSVVEIQYKLTNSSGELLDSTQLSLLQGEEEVPKELEDALYGKTIDDSFNLKIENAFGKVKEKFIRSVSREQFGEDASNLKVGMQFHVETDGEEIIARITELTEKEALLNGNHPLAGQTLSFEVLVVDIRQATKDELEQGSANQKKSSCACC